MSGSLLILYLVLSHGQPRPTGSVVLVNAGPADVRVWNEGNSWGDAALSFELLHAGIISRVTRRDQEYTRNVPSSFLLLAGGRHEWTFDLGDGDWIFEPPPGELTGPNAQLTAIFEISASTEASEQKVWIGRVRSSAAMLGLRK